MITSDAGKAGHRPGILRVCALLALLTALAGIGPGTGHAAATTATTYTITDLGTIDGGSTSAAIGINRGGQVVGNAVTAYLTPSGYVIHVCLWTPSTPNGTSGVMRDLGAFSSQVSSLAGGLNDAGQVVGTSQGHAFLWQDGRGVTYFLGTSPTPLTSANGINAAGQVVGQDGSDAYVWTPDAPNGTSGTVADLGTLGGPDSAAIGINNAGWVAGRAQTAGYPYDWHAFLWTPGAPGLADLGASDSVAAINSAGQIVGQAGNHAFLWNPGTGMADLGTLGGSYSWAYGVNAAGQVVGQAQTASYAERAVLWQPGQNGGMTIIDLNTLLPAGSGWVLAQAHGINDAGQIVGQGMIGNQYHAFLLTPASAPADTTPPTTSATLDPTPNAAGWESSDATVTLTATDEAGGSGVKQISYSATGAQPIASTTVAVAQATITISAEGTTTLSYYATDNAGNQESPQTLTVKLDKTPPVLAPGDIASDATGPSGAVVNYAVTATDNLDPSPLVNCAPASGSTFPIGDTVVACTAADAAGNSAKASFTVHVRGAAEQLNDLTATVESFNLQQGIATSLESQLQQVQAALSAANAANRADACTQLAAFENEVRAQSGKALTTDQAGQLLAAAGRIAVVMGCS